ncbi:hypothetical protein [Cryobacterium sp. 10C3]|nr:hypothetical protein [Cryobacterium sp. 10C3]MDY7556875.1 hypothetical protein [Cryobacterium sp. 10C3]
MIRALWAFLASCPVPADETLLATSSPYVLRLVDDGVAPFDRKDELTT